MSTYSHQIRTRAITNVLDGGRTAADVARELELPSRTVSRWVRAERIRRRAEWWAEQVGQHFDSLTAYGFSLVEVRAEDWRQLTAVYQAERVAVLVVFDRMHGAVDVKLYPTIELKLPSRANGRSFVLPMYYLGNLSAAVLIDRGERRAILSRHNKLTDDRVGVALAFWAALVQERAEPFLRGDLSLLYANRRRDYPPPTITLMVHRHACADEVRAATDRVHEVFPTTKVVIQRYPVPAELAQSVVA